MLLLHLLFKSTISTRLEQVKQKLMQKVSEGSVELNPPKPSHLHQFLMHLQKLMQKVSEDSVELNPPKPSHLHQFLFYLFQTV